MEDCERNSIPQMAVASWPEMATLAYYWEAPECSSDVAGWKSQLVKLAITELNEPRLKRERRPLWVWRRRKRPETVFFSSSKALRDYIGKSRLPLDLAFLVWTRLNLKTF